MKTAFTVHIGEYIAGDALEKKYNVWIPTRDTGVDLLVTNKENTRATTIQVKFSKDFSLTDMKPNIKGIGWWTLNRAKIKYSKAEFWIFVLYSFQKKAHDFVIITPAELLNLFDATGRTNDSRIHCYMTTTKDGDAFETRGLKGGDVPDQTRNLKNHLNNWTRIADRLTPRK